MAKAKLGGLGKGLDALFVDNDTKDSGNMMLRLSSIEPNKDQPRKQFDEDALMELADSIRQHGVIQPLLVRPLDNVPHSARHHVFLQEYGIEIGILRYEPHPALVVLHVRFQGRFRAY